MADWDNKLMKLCSKWGLTANEAARYVDDIRLWLRAVELGWRWSGDCLEFRQEWRQEETEQGVTDEQKTAEVLGELMNTISSQVKITTETKDDFSSGTLPTLDVQIWMENELSLYKFYEKPMTNKRVLSRQTAMGENSKIASLTQEVIRRCRNTCHLLPQNIKNEILDQFAIKLVSSGHSREQARRILISGLRGYERQLKRHLSGEKQLHRPHKEGLKERSKRKLLSKSSWFRPKPKQEGKQEMTAKKTAGSAGINNSKVTADRTNDNAQQPATPKTTTVLFVEKTPGGELARLLREKEKMLSELTGFTVKIVESNGKSFKQLLCDPNPWATKRCSRDDCYPCQAGCDQCCYTRNIVYSHSCTCGKQYIGESCRSAYERGREHQADYVKKKPENHQWKHQVNDHSGEEDSQLQFKWKVELQCKSALTRQISEAVLIRRRGAGLILNSRAEYNRCRLPRLVMEHHEEEEEVRGSPEPTNEEVTEMWQHPTNRKRGSDGRGRKGGRGEAQSYSKKIRLETEHIARAEGIKKRKSYQNKKHFEADCKRMRPSFDQFLDEEEEGKQQQEKKAEYDCILTKASKVTKPKTAQQMFPIFVTSFSKLFKVNENPPINRNLSKKKSLSKRKCKAKAKLPLRNAQITTFFNRKTHPVYGEEPPQYLKCESKANPAPGATTHPSNKSECPEAITEGLMRGQEKVRQKKCI